MIILKWITCYSPDICSKNYMSFYVITLYLMLYCLKAMPFYYDGDTSSLKSNKNSFLDFLQLFIALD